MPNALAYLALFAFIPLGVAAFSMFRPPIAAVMVYLTSLMFLPEMTELDLPGLPGIGKQEVAALACLFGVLLRARRKLFAARPLRGPDLFLLLLFVGDLGTALTNRDVITHGPTVLPALSLREGISLIIFDSLRYLFPFLIGRALFQTAKDLRQCLSAIAIAGALYTPFLFIELMLSPQLHNWIYGFHQHDFLQTIRGGGYRPMVFMSHGLAVGLFMAWAALAATTLFKARKKVSALPAPVVSAWNFGWLFACKSLGAALYATAMAPLVWFLRPKAVVRVCAVVGVIVISYPILRATDVFPEKKLVAAASIVSARAAQSLEFRFFMESQLSEHARERPVFGWGRFRRNMIFDEWSGRDISISDGHWIVSYSIRGAWGFLAIFGLIVWPIFSLRKRLRRVDANDARVMLAGLCAMVAVAALDLIPNALHSSFTIFLVGVLWGTTKGISSEPADDVDDVPATIGEGAASPVAPDGAVPGAFRPQAQGAAGTRKREPFE